MKKNLLLYIPFMIALMVIVISCSEDEAPVLEEREQILSINNSSSSIVLNFSYPDNPAMTLEWDENETPAASYTITFSTSSAFETSSQLGTSDTDNFTITVGDLNTQLLAAGAEPYSTFAFFVRIEGGGDTSSPVAFSATPYAEASPSLETPATTSFVLDVTAPDETVVAINFGDFAPENVGNADESDIQLSYTLQTALGGSDFAEPIDVETISNLDGEIGSQSFVLSNRRANELALSAGIAAEAEGTLDFRVRSVIVSQTGTQERVSDAITLTVTPYNVEAFPIFFVGAGTAAGWNNPASPVTNHHPLFPNIDNPNQYSYTGYFANDGFKMIRDLGSWDAQWGAGGENELSTDGGSGNLGTGGEGYFTFSVDIGALTYSVEPFDEASAPDYTANGMGITGAGVGGWDDPARIPMTQSAFDKHIWFATGVQFFDDEFKFKETNGWGVQFGAVGQGANSWPYDKANGGDNLRAQAGTYTVFLNDLTGDYWMIEE